MELRESAPSLALLAALLALILAGLAVLEASSHAVVVDGFSQLTRIGASVRQWLHSAAAVCIGIALLVIVDTFFLGWLSIKQVALGREVWQYSPPPVRAAVIIGWFLLAHTLITSVTRGILAL